jgi:homoserine dehydrogenase
MGADRAHPETELALMREMRLVLVGFGNVGRALARLLLQKREELERRYALTWRAVGIATGSHGTVFAADGLDLEAACLEVESGGDLTAIPGMEAVDGPIPLLRASAADLMFENTPVDYAKGQPAVEHIRTGLDLGMHVVTANKGPVVHAYRQLADLAQAKGARFLFESTVMDGAPIFSLWRETLPAARLRGFRGVLNSTTNLILGLMEDGKSFDEAVAHAQTIGIAETDPSGDIDGWDASVKVAALVSVLMNHPMTPDQVQRSGIRQITQDEIRQAADQSKRWKLVCQAEERDGQLHASVQPLQVTRDDPLYQVGGTSSAVTFWSDILGPLTVLESDPGPETTAYGLLADFIRAATGDLGRIHPNGWKIGG